MKAGVKAGAKKGGKVAVKVPATVPANVPAKVPAKAQVKPQVKPQVRVVARDIRGFLDRIDDASVEGWAFDAAAPQEKLKLRVLIDGAVIDVVDCNRNRNDVGGFNLADQAVGFFYTIPVSFQDGLRHILQFATLEGQRVSLGSRGGMVLPELHFCLTRQTFIEGCLDGLVDGLIQGWALEIDKKGKFKTGGVRIMVSVGGLPVAELVADQFRRDVAESLQADVACGFSFSPPSALRTGTRLMLAFHAMPGRHELRNSPVEVIFPADGERQRIQALIARTDELFTYAYHLRRDLLAALPGERYMLGDYALWAQKSLPLAQARAAARYGDMPRELPFVSVICPVFKPDIGAFLTAVDSMTAQSYANWELILVDDGSADAQLSATMARLAAHDKRVKLLSLPENAGISEATNRGLRAARGQFIAFFDHDDVLEPGALEIMVRAQAATGARLLYSDEDKIDRLGVLSEPHFKPDFNYRFLLEVNYICHFVMVEAAVAKKIGLFNPALDGAQDHDFLLRATEILLPEHVHHVAEVLYHWRKSAGSSAAWAGAKPAAGSAGQRAVAAHLSRRKLAASVKRRGAMTCYQINWEPDAALRKRAGVSIIIPFRDHIEQTRACVEAIRKYTRDVSYELILVDNWSSGAGAEAFCVEQANLPHTQVVRIAQAFNYSLLNNQAVQRARHEFLLFLNNDVFVKNPDWLRAMLNECLVDEKVAAVGAKLLYANGTVQHAGVVLGVGGVADHAFRGQPGQAPGYVMRAMATQEISAVTAACMLVRKAAFEAVGGFDEAELAVAFNDVDLCLKLTGAGWRIIYAPDVVLEHHESMSRGDDLTEGKISRFMLENKVMTQRYADRLPFDPFYNQHFSREGGVYRELRLLEP